MNTKKAQNRAKRMQQLAEKRRALKKTLLRVGIIACAVIVVAVAILGVFMIKGGIQSALTPERRAITADIAYDYSLSFSEVSFKSSDGVTLSGWWIPATKSSSKTVILAHYYDGSRIMTPVNVLIAVADLVNNGYNVLTFDFRGHGESGDAISTFGYDERLDVLAAISFAKSKGSESIALHGFAMGAVASLYAAAETSDVKCVIAESAYSSIPDFIKRRSETLSGLVSPFAEIAASYIIKEAGVESVPTLDTVVPSIRCGLFFVHAADDGFISYEQSTLLHSRAHADANLWVVPNAGGHLTVFWDNYDMYMGYILDFLGLYM